MSASVPPRDGGAHLGSPPSSAIPDEEAMRRLFDAEYATQIASAKTQLGEAAALAPKVVETAFINAWVQRATLTHGAQVKTFLVDEVHHGAARALSRRAAAHRFGSHGGRDDGGAGPRASNSPEVDAARSWGEIQKSMRGEGASSAAHAAAAQASRHGAASHMKTVGKRPGWLVPVLGVVVLLGVLAAAGLYFDKLGADDAILTAVQSTTIQPAIQSSPGQIGSTTLSDSTKIRIGPDSKLFYPDGFPTKIHAFRFEGTAQFDVPAVADEKALVLHVVARRTHFIASGASFVLTAFATDSVALVQVRQGSVTVKNEKGTQVVPAGQALMVDSTGLHAPTEAQVAEAFGWVDGKVTSNRHLRDALANLSRWFNMDIKVPDLPLLDRDATFSVALDSSRAAITQLEKSANVKFGYEGETKAFRDAKKQ